MLRECVASVLGQSYPNIEIIIGNDFVEQPVTFDSLGIRDDPRVKIVNHAKNIGAFNNNHYVLREAKGDWFTWLADDDLMHPDFLRAGHEVMVTFDVQAIFANYLASPDPRGVFPAQLGPMIPRILSGREFIDCYISRKIRTVGNSGLFRRELFKQLGDIQRFGTGLPVYGDTFMPILAAVFGDIAYLDHKLVFLRTHADSRSAGLDCIEHYSSAQKDFLIAFKQHCGDYLGEAEYEHQLVNMLKWFTGDGWHVICRKHTSTVRRLFEFFQYLTDTIFPQVPVRSKGTFGLSAGTMAVRDSLKYLGSRLLKEMKRWN